MSVCNYPIQLSYDWCDGLTVFGYCDTAMGCVGVAMGEDDVLAFVECDVLPPTCLWLRHPARAMHRAIAQATVAAIKDGHQLADIRDAARARRHAREALASLNLEP